MISVVAEFADGTVHEVGIVGHEGSSGALELLSAITPVLQSFVQLPGTCLAIPAAFFSAALNDDPELRTSLNRYAYAFQNASSQLAACNSTHTVLQRAAKWLLMAHDCVAGDVVDLTHEFISEMLSVRRASVSETAKQLKDKGAIDYKRGQMAIVNRTLLETLSCECYRATSDNAAAILGYDPRKPSPSIRFDSFDHAKSTQLSRV